MDQIIVTQPTSIQKQDRNNDEMNCGNCYNCTDCFGLTLCCNCNDSGCHWHNGCCDCNECDCNGCDCNGCDCNGCSGC